MRIRRIDLAPNQPPSPHLPHVLDKRPLCRLRADPTQMISQRLGVNHRPLRSGSAAQTGQVETRLHHQPGVGQDFAALLNPPHPGQLPNYLYSVQDRRTIPIAALQAVCLHTGQNRPQPARHEVIQHRIVVTIGGQLSLGRPIGKQLLFDRRIVAQPNLETAGPLNHSRPMKAHPPGPAPTPARHPPTADSVLPTGPIDDSTHSKPESWA